MKTSELILAPFLLTSVLLGMFASSLAFSTEVEEPDRFYAKIELGSSTFPSYQATGTTVLSESKVGDLISLGVGLELSSFLSFELTHNQFGKANGKLSTPALMSYDTEVTSNALSVIPSIPLGSKTHFFVELGEHVWEADSTVGGISSSQDGSDFFYGFGFTYDVREEIRTGFAFSKYNLDSDDFSTMTVSLAYLF